MANPSGAQDPATYDHMVQVSETEKEEGDEGDEEVEGDVDGVVDEEDEDEENSQPPDRTEVAPSKLQRAVDQLHRCGADPLNAASHLPGKRPRLTAGETAAAEVQPVWPGDDDDDVEDEDEDDGAGSRGHRKRSPPRLQAHGSLNV